MLHVLLVNLLDSYRYTDKLWAEHSAVSSPPPRQPPAPTRLFRMEVAADKRPRRTSAAATAALEQGSDDEQQGSGPRHRGSAAGAPQGTAEERILAGETLAERQGLALDVLGELDADGWFAEPVTEEVAPGYGEFVDKPMDFSTMRKKLEAGAYGDDDASLFAADMRLIFCNAVTCVRDGRWHPSSAHASARAPSCSRALAARRFPHARHATPLPRGPRPHGGAGSTGSRTTPSDRRRWRR